MTNTQPRTITDAALEDAVTAELRWTPSIDSADIGVAVSGGAVTLSGSVESYPQRLLAERAALRVRGVTAVAQDITVSNSWATRTDAEIATEATEALERAVDVPPGSVRVAVNGHHVTLSGEVPWHFQAEAAERAVRYVRGIFGVSDHVTISPSASPEGVAASITAALVRSAQIDGDQIAVTTEGGSVTLDGYVESWAERRHAESAAWSARGVTKVTNHLTLI